MAVARRAALPIRSVQPLPARVLIASGLAAVVLMAAATTQQYPLYVIIAFGILPWLPVLFLETLSQYRNFHWLAAFFAITVLQVGHLGEHAIQITQLFMNDGLLAHSHGALGQLDFETVHFFWDTAVWLGTLVLIWRYGRQNSWLWVSLVFASAHEVEHMYLYYVNLFEYDFYHSQGGFAGIFGKGGMVPTVSRPYLHFGYNFLVVIPMVIAYLKQLSGSLETMERKTARRIPHSTEA
jgi:hypothetical protein